MPIAVGPIIGFAVFAALVLGGWFLFDAVGDARESKVRAEYAEAARKKNIEIGAFNSADDAVAALMEATLRTRTTEAAGINAPSCPATKEQARALTAIRRLR